MTNPERVDIAPGQHIDPGCSYVHSDEVGVCNKCGWFFKHPCAYTGEACETCGCVDECMGIGVGYYDRHALAKGELRRID